MSYNNYNVDRGVNDASIRNNYGRTSTISYSSLIQKVYTWMTLALVITGLCSYGVATSPAILSFIFSNQIVFWGMIIAEFGLVLGLSSRIDRISLTTGTIMFILYSILNGVLLSSIFLLYTMESIGQVFFITAGTFGAMSCYGYFTKTDLTSWGKLLLMALVGIIIATIVNFFVGSSQMQMIISYIGVLVFVGLTAYDTQKIKVLISNAGTEEEAGQKIALLGALTLYLDFINLFIYLIRIFGKRR